MNRVVPCIAIALAGCPPHRLPETAALPNPHVVKAPAGYKVENCLLVPDGEPGPSTERACYPGWSWRPSGPVDTCARDHENDNGLCYPPCRPGYTGDGPLCWKDCPAGYRDDGVTCRRNASVVRAARDNCPGYDLCGLTFARGCTRCPEGYRNDGCTCMRDLHVIAQDSYGRGVGQVPGCADDEEQIWLTCYEDCPAGSRADSLMCVEDQQQCAYVPVQPVPHPTFCVLVRGEHFCTTTEQQADTAENAEAMALCRICENCTAEIIACSTTTQQCQ